MGDGGGGGGLSGLEDCDDALNRKRKIICYAGRACQIGFATNCNRMLAFRSPSTDAHTPTHARSRPYNGRVAAAAVAATMATIIAAWEMTHHIICSGKPSCQLYYYHLQRHKSHVI